MGAKIGRRVYWPSSGLYCPDPELLEIGDDVVFGHRPFLITTDAQGTEKIVIENGGEGFFFSYPLEFSSSYIILRSQYIGSSCTSSWDTGWYPCSHGFRNTGEAKWDLRSRFNLDRKW
jgi:hypothetical protein